MYALWICVHLRKILTYSPMVPMASPNWHTLKDDHPWRCKTTSHLLVFSGHDPRASIQLQSPPSQFLHASPLLIEMIPSCRKWLLGWNYHDFADPTYRSYWPNAAFLRGRLPPTSLMMGLSTWRDGWSKTSSAFPNKIKMEGSDLVPGNPSSGIPLAMSPLASNQIWSFWHPDCGPQPAFWICCFDPHWQLDFADKIWQLDGPVQCSRSSNSCGSKDQTKQNPVGSGLGRWRGESTAIASALHRLGLSCRFKKKV